MVEMLNFILSASSQSESPNDKITSHKNVIKDDSGNFEASSSDSGFESRDYVKYKVGKFPPGQAVQKLRREETRKQRFRELALEWKNSSPNLSTKLELPEIDFTNFSNIKGKKIKKKVYKQEKVTLQSIMNRSWTDILKNNDDISEKRRNPVKNKKQEKKFADEKQKRLKNLTEKVAKGLQNTVFFIREAFKK